MFLNSLIVKKQNLLSLLRFYVCLVIMLPFYSFAQISQRVFLVGNSTTDQVNYLGLQSIANQKGNSHIWSRSVVLGASLAFNWNNPNSAFKEDPYGYYPNALANYEWDAITLQPFNAPLDGDQGDIAMASNFINLAKIKSPNIQPFIYQRHCRIPNGMKWPSAPSSVSGVVATASDWRKIWDGEFVQGAETRQVRSQYTTLTNALRAANLTSKPTNMIPVGEVMYNLNNKMDAGSVPGFTSIWDVYVDAGHFNNVGQFIVGATFFATIYKQDPRGLVVPGNYGTIPNAVRDTILNTIYQTVFSHSLSGTSFADIVPVSSVSISPKEFTLSFLQSTSLSAVVMPSNAGNKRIIWSSANTSVALVNDRGIVTGIGTGVTTIFGSSAIYDKTDYSIVTVIGLSNYTSTSGLLANWQLMGKGSSTNIPANTSAQGVSTITSDLLLGLGSGLNLRTSSGVSHGITASRQTAPSLQASIADNEYLFFKVAPERGKFLTINMLRLYPYSQNVARKFGLFSSVKGFSINNLITTFSGQSNFSVTITLTGHSTLSDPVEFRLYAFNDISSVPNQYEAVGIGFNGDATNDLEIFGEVLTPIDNLPPTSVTGLAANSISNNGFELSWEESSDNMVVWGYNVYNNGVKLNANLIKETNYSFSGLLSGSYNNITVTSEDFLGNTSSPTQLTVVTNRPPTAVINVSTTLGYLPLSVSFNSVGSSDPDQEFGDYVLGYDWDFGDNSGIDNSNVPTHVYSVPGVYIASLRVVDTRNVRSNYVYQSITVLGLPNVPSRPSTVSGFKMLNKDLNSLVVTWNAINNTTIGYNLYINSEKVNTHPLHSSVHTFTGLTENTSYFVEIEAIDNIGQTSDKVSLNILTNDKPVASISSSALQGVAPIVVSLSGVNSTDSDSLVLYSWTIDGSVFYDKEIVYGFTLPGVYKIEMQVTDVFGATSSIAYTQIEVDSLPSTKDSLSLSLHNSYLEQNTPIVYPNPAKDFLYISVPTFVKIIDMQGNIKYRSKDKKSVVNISNMASGFYVVILDNSTILKIKIE